MIFVDLAPLQQQPPGAIPDQNGECPMQVAAPVRFEFLRDADFPILMIDENDVFLKHGPNIPPRPPAPP
jgi:hypothetical protein